MTLQIQEQPRPFVGPPAQVLRLTEPDDQSDQEKADNVAVSAIKFRGQSTEIALILSGVHARDEPEGPVLAREIEKGLIQQAFLKRGPKFTTYVIEQLIADSRFDKTDLRLVPITCTDPENPKKTFGPQDPNRNFPAPGESYSYAQAKAQRVKDAPELFVCGPAGVSPLSRVIAENRILIEMIEQFKPKRILSIHSHRRKNRPYRRGNEPGVFVDPRGGFDLHADKAYTGEGQEDDDLCRLMFYQAYKGIQVRSLPADDTETQQVLTAHPLRGNLTVKDGGKFVVGRPDRATVHYSCGASHAQGTSLGDWGPVTQKVAQPPDRRPGAPVITLELPKGYQESQRLNEMWNMIVQDVFLGGINRL